MSPILVRPVREQLEHDRVIRLLQAKYKRKFEVAINPGNEQSVPVGSGPSPWYPDLVLQSGERSRKILGVVEVETSESVNNLEAMSQWAAFSRLRVPFHLYIPVSSVDTARRLCTDLQIPTTELWAYHTVGDQLRFTLVQRAQQASDGRSRAASESATPRSRETGSTRPSAIARTAASSSRPSSGSRARPVAARPSRRAATPAAPVRRAAVAKTKASASRRAAPKPAARKPAPASSRASKRR